MSEITPAPAESSALLPKSPQGRSPRSSISSLQDGGQNIQRDTLKRVDAPVVTKTRAVVVIVAIALIIFLQGRFCGL
jgi:hypothetical protein